MQNSSPVELKLDPDGFTLNELLLLHLCLYIDVFDFCVLMYILQIMYVIDMSLFKSPTRRQQCKRPLNLNA